MGEQFDASRPIYAQLVERLKPGSWPAPTAGRASGFST